MRAHIFTTKASTLVPGRILALSLAVLLFTATAASPAQGASPGPTPPPSNEFSFGEVKKNERDGRAKLTVNVPGGGDLVLAKTQKVRAAGERAEVAGEVKLPIRPRGKAQKKLKEKGKAKVTAKVTFEPDGGTPNTEDKTIQLVKR